MTQEHFLTGYCRQLDGSRTVWAETENERLRETDCGFEGCPYAPQCTIGQALLNFRETLNKSSATEQRIFCSRNAG